MTNTQQNWPYPGSRWWKFDFHTHTPASADTYWTQQGIDLSPQEWLLRYMAAEIDCVAITDHNSGTWVDRLKAAYEEMKGQADAGSPSEGFRNLTLFPGAEISVQGGFHLLAILDPDTTTSDIDALLGQVDYHGTKGSSDGVTRKGATDVVCEIRDAGGIPIPAHADRQGENGNGKGLLAVRAGTRECQLDANTVRQVLDTECLLAMEWEDMEHPLPKSVEKQVKKLAHVLGSDCHNFRGTGIPGSRFTWVKMAKPTLEGLRLALLDGGGFSIRRSDNPEPFAPFSRPKHCIEAIEIADARYMGNGTPVRLEFNPWLNALIGGRGTGKSTIIHALRLAARRTKEIDHLEARSIPRLTFESFNQVPSGRSYANEGGLTPSTEILWLLKRDDVRHRVRWREDGKGTVVEDGVNGSSWKPSSTEIVTPERFPVRIFSQGQIAALAGENQQALLQVIDEAAGVAANQRELIEARDVFYASKAKIRALDGKLARQTGLEVELEDVSRKLKKFEDAGHSSVLTIYRRRGRQREEVNRQFDSTEAMAKRIETTADDLQIENPLEKLFDEASVDERPIAESLKALAEAVGVATRDLQSVAQRLRESVATQRQTLGESVWSTAVKQAEDDYAAFVERLRSEGVADPNEYSHLAQDRQRLQSELANLNSIREEQRRLIEESQQYLRKVLKCRRAVSERREAFLSQALSENRFVRIRNRRYGDNPQIIELSFREALGDFDHFERDILNMESGRSKGIVAQLIENLPENPTERYQAIENRIEHLKQRIAAACGGKGDFGGPLNNYLQRNFERVPEFLDKLLAWFPDDSLIVEYSRQGDGADFQPIAQASAGQRSAAMLAFLLAHGEEPLVLDQPEDDLDNHLIYDLVVRQIRANKLRRQIIVVTHNPNIVVNGDADMLHALDFKVGQCRVIQSGSLQEESIREEVCRIMEGGREAFERRYRRLGSESRHVR